MRIISVVGARPNFMKIAPLEREFKKVNGVEHLIVHTGQHYGEEMNDVLFRQLGLPEPARHLGVGSGKHGEMTGKIMIAFEQVCEDLDPSLVIVVGDVNSTLAAALVAKKELIPVAHVEAGLRSFDETMPEEINRRVTDHVSDLLFASEPSGVRNLQKEGIVAGRIHLVGDIMLETLQMFAGEITSRKRWEDFALEKKSYALVTVHRPSNVDDASSLKETIDVLKIIKRPIVFPVHPRTVERLHRFRLWNQLESVPHLIITEPQPYLDFLSLLEGASLILSDSGSVQSEASFFNVPCLVCRKNTERPIYIEQGTSQLVGRSKERVSFFLQKIQNGQYQSASPEIDKLGCGVARKIVQTVKDYLVSH